MARSSFAKVAAMVGMLTAGARALRVTQPSEGMTVVSETPYPVEWTGASPDTRFEIDLAYCGSYSFCFDDLGDCGFLLERLCKDDAGCVQDAEGGYDVMFPEPTNGISGNGYRVRIAEVGGGLDKVRCSDDFYIASKTDMSMQGEPGGPSLYVVSPTAESVAIAGGEYTVEFEYNNGFGNTVGRFKIDLYSQDGDGGWMGDCGGWVGSICDKPDIGCKDTTGDYDVVIPKHTPPGHYKIRIGLFGDDSVYSCSETFEVLDMGAGLWE